MDCTGSGTALRRIYGRQRVVLNPLKHPSPSPRPNRRSNHPKAAKKPLSSASLLRLNNPSRRTGHSVKDQARTNQVHSPSPTHPTHPPLLHLRQHLYLQLQDPPFPHLVDAVVSARPTLSCLRLITRTTSITRIKPTSTAMVTDMDITCMHPVGGARILQSTSAKRTALML